MIVSPGIDQRPNGKFRVRVMRRGQRVSREFDTFEAAERFRDSTYASLSAGKLNPVRGMSLAQAGPAFLAKRKDLRNYRTDKSRWNVHLLTAHFAAKPLTTVTRRDVLDWVDDLEGKQTSDRREARTVSRQLRKHCLNLLRKFFDYCVDRDIVPANPARGVKVGGEANPIPDDWYLTPEEQAKLQAFEGVERWIALFAMGTGLRQGEQWNLRLVDVHLDGERPYVFVRYGSEGRTPKSKKARTVPLFGLGLYAARQWLALLPTYAKRNPLGLMFPTQRGYRRQRSKVPRTWSSMVAHLGRHVHWHLLRHTAASSLVAGWWGRQWTLEEVKVFMGHSSVTVTERYAHLAGSRLHAVARETEGVWSRDHENTEIPAVEAYIIRPSKPNVAGSTPAGRTDSYDTSRDHAGTRAVIRAALGAMRVA